MRIIDPTCKCCVGIISVDSGGILMKARRLPTLAVFLVTLFTLITVSAAVQYLIHYSDATYATNNHVDIDTYIGVASIRGSDRKLSGSTWEYPQLVKVTYDVQGHIFSTTVYSNGNTDGQIRQKSITVEDIWNAGPTTKAYGRSVWGISTGPNPYSIGFNE